MSTRVVGEVKGERERERERESTLSWYSFRFSVRSPSRRRRRPCVLQAVGSVQQLLLKSTSVQVYY